MIDSYVMAETPESLLLADIETGLASEVPWTYSGNEKFYFDLENVRLHSAKSVENLHICMHEKYGG